MALYDTSTPPSKTEPSQKFLALTPSDTLDVPRAVRAIYVGSGGDLSVEDVDGTVTLFDNVAESTVLPIKPVKVMATSTTASSIVGLL